MKIALLGDGAFYGKFSLENKNVFNYLKPMTEALKTFELVVLNLETPFIKKDSKIFGNKSAYIGALEENVELLKYLGVSMVNLANNHMFDYGSKAYRRTLQILDDNRIAYFGTEDRQCFIEKDNNKLAFSGYCCFSTNPIGMGKDGLNILNINNVEKNMIENNKKGYFNIVSIHAGQEHVNYPNYDNILMSRKWAELMPYIYYGHHPHVLQGIEEYKGSLIAHSLGNFCFDDVYISKSKNPLIKMNENNKRSGILSVIINDNKITSHQFLPIFDAKLADSKLNEEINHNMAVFSEQLQKRKNYYITARAKKIDNYIASRKKMRNFEWYVSRMNFRSIGMIINAYCNSKKYYENVKRYL